MTSNACADWLPASVAPPSRRILHRNLPPVRHGKDRGRHDARHFLTVRFQVHDPVRRTPCETDAQRRALEEERRTLVDAVARWASEAGLEVVERRGQTVVVCSSTAAVEAALQIRIHDFEWLGLGGACHANIDAPTIPSHLAIERIDGLHLPYVVPRADSAPNRYAYVRTYERG